MPASVVIHNIVTYNVFYRRMYETSIVYIITSYLLNNCHVLCRSGYRDRELKIVPVISLKVKKSFVRYVTFYFGLDNSKI